ncbi:Phosphatidylinositol 4,5-bisphosphate 3-kinase catalytic subunit alpha isoform [Schistosoma japonicum]|nr:Phosphatidylinositol 4,5-bisphosphate 3-kinase catalytic subunit alpha isoform [Schistosoma japonicum]KAH8854641.1 Phosphatidylinositol 4,5-bisphosphate 3-kinase catalytic subunit alpha isoform [Schistosoma japonicum]KAH8854642.1 Phosphatidylinositol 4,5-bisphosphate 3-kinase catalytic subunit alpha isoform [Schistosoma japonicum]KAH8854643.1 Phosphatidylinositol 4,5-bisphosphate 3-kinase catalytic subunit alpha isoform [Schistosoma japonicum]KAH8854644.1 Phosphatidylinositol 4,5-bisphosphat
MSPTTKLKRTFSLLVGSDITVRFLLPNGIIVPLTLSSESTLEEIRIQLWISAAKLPLFDILQSRSDYIFVGINRETGDEEEFYDLSRRLHELPLILPYLLVTEAARDSTILEINAQNAAIASCTGIPYTDIVRACRTNPEVKWARLRLLRIANMHTKILDQTGSDGLIRYLTSASKRELSQSLKILLQKHTHLTITAWVLDGKDPPEKCCVVVKLNKKATVFEALNEILHSQAELAKQDCQANMNYGLPKASNYLLKVCCSQAYLFDSDELLIRYEYIQQCIEQYQHPCLSPILKNDIKQSFNYSLKEYSIYPACKLNHNNNWIFSSKSTINRCANNAENNNLADLYQNFEKILIDHDKFDNCETRNLTDSIEENNVVSQSPVDPNKINNASGVDDFGRAFTPTSFGDCSLKNVEFKQKHSKSQLTLSHERREIVSLWDLSGFLSIQVCSAQFLVENVTCSDSSSTTSLPLSVISSSFRQPNSNLIIQHTNVDGAAALDGSYVVRVGIFHGSQFLIECQTTNERPGNYLTWREWLNFHILLADLPVATRICVALIRIRKNIDRKNVRLCEYLYGWANVNLFDHNGFMITDEVTLNLWPPSLVQTANESLHSWGTVLGNPNPEFSMQIKVHNPTLGRIRRPTVNCFINAFHTKQFNSSFQSYSNKHPLKGYIDDNNVCVGKTKANYSFRTTEINDVIESCTFMEPVNIETINGSTCDEDPSKLPDFNPSEFLFNKPANNNITTSTADDLTDKILESRLREIVSRDPLYELCEQEKDYLWRGRYWCLNNLPSALPWICQVVNWCGRDTLAEFYTLIHQWPHPFSVDIALRLLGAFDLTRSNSNHTDLANGLKVGASGIADIYIRQLAVNSLYNLSDAELNDYLLQLVQALKAETYLDNALTRFLLYRALKNPLQIGLRFFWHLRSELHLPDIRLRFGLILEAFCRGCGPMLALFSRQVTALNRLEALSTRVKELASEEEQRELFYEEVSRPEALHDLQWLPSPLCISETLGELLIHKCDVKRSKKKPLWLVWTNSDRLAQFHHKNYQMIFKHGDDLRQDMLTLQLFKLMDRIWKEEGMDMCLTSYGCFATGYEMGIIEAVRDSRTVMSIQGERLRSALQIDSSQLYKWLMQHAKQKAKQLNHSTLSDNCAYERMIRTFTMSCAGYCIATFILGIRDRHPDNIMVDSTGRLFHIDFGHILDNRKKKFGFTRERVPFVLTRDFVTVIARGNPDGGSLMTTNIPSSTVHATVGEINGNIHFQEFTDLCGKAYLLLRRHSNLILTLLAMMLPSGLPELTSVCDLEYVRKTLAVEIDNEQEALAYFHHKFNEAYSGAWTTKIDWFSHWMNT